MDDINFCPTCGKELPAGSTFCLACGTNVNDPAKDVRSLNSFDAVRSQERIDMSVIILLICAAIGLITGILGAVAPDAVTDFFLGGMRADLEIELAKQNVTWDDVVALFEMGGIILLIGGVLAAVAMVLAQRRRVWFATFAMSLISMLILLLTFIGFILCFVAVWKLYKARSAFTD